MAINTGDLNKCIAKDETSLGNDVLTAILQSAEDLVTGEGWLDGINTLLAELGMSTGVSRVWIFQTLDIQTDFIIQDYAFEWFSHKKYKQIGLPHFNHFTSQLVEPEYIDLMESRKRGEYQSLITAHLPDAWLKSHLEEQGIKSMLTIPIIIDNQWWGTLGLDDCERECTWSANEIIMLRTASYFISSAIVRDDYRAKQNQLEILKENIACSSWELDSRRGYLWCTSEVLNPDDNVVSRKLFNFKQWLERIHPDHRRPFLEMAKGFLTSSDETTFHYDLKIRRSTGQYCWIEISCNSIKTEPEETTRFQVFSGI
ncbi:GAF domain-containing protein [Marinomonas algicola]|uniref:GAF domain-containing protein n=1 Tax=Marinomonas algicola TaxID=2773454 RepID=UPI00174E8B19|nr:GAF domain-containing protein [Marinomonas algicola]